MAYLTGVGWCVYLAKEKAAARAKELEEAAAEAERVQEVRCLSGAPSLC